MRGALHAASLTGWLHQLIARGGRLAGHGVRDGQAIIATLRHLLIRVPAWLVRPTGPLTLRLQPARRGPHPHPRTARDVLAPTGRLGPRPVPEPVHRGDTRALELRRFRGQSYFGSHLSRLRRKSKEGMKKYSPPLSVIN